MLVALRLTVCVMSVMWVAPMIIDCFTKFCLSLTDGAFIILKWILPRRECAHENPFINWERHNGLTVRTCLLLNIK